MKDTRTNILRAAARFFAQKGFSGTSVREIVAAAGENVAAINYHFGSKKKLYQETVHYLIEKHRSQVWGKKTPPPTEEEISNYSYRQALDWLHTIMDHLLETGLGRKNLPLERIFTQAELESAAMRKMLFSYVAPFHTLPYKLLARLTGLPEKSPELLVVSHSIFGQVMLSESHRLVILDNMGVKHISPVLREQIKQVVWRHTLAILNSYKKGKKQK